MSPAKVIPWRLVSPAPVVLVFGPQEYFAERAIKAVRDKFASGESIEVAEVDATTYSAGSIFDLASAGLFGERKVVIFQTVERCADALITDGLEYLANPSEDSVVIFRHTGSSVRGKKLLEAIRASDLAIEATCVDLPKEFERVAFVEAEFTSKNRKIQRQAAVALVDIFGKDLEELSAACSQLQNDDAGEITPQIVEKYFGGRLETTNFKIADSAIEGRASESLLLLRHALDQGVDGVQVITAFGKKINEMGRIIGNPRASYQELGMPDWAFNKARAACASWTEEGLANVIHALAETDYAIKGGQKDPHYALEKLVRLVANKGRTVE